MDLYGITDAQILAELGERLKATRIKKGFSQADVAERAGISVFTVSQMERGKNSSLSSLIAVMRVLKLLENFDSLVPEQVVSPVELLTKSKRRR
jgi:transcriptional regulator with XRE-family HTH domain